MIPPTAEWTAAQAASAALHAAKDAARAARVSAAIDAAVATNPTKDTSMLHTNEWLNTAAPATIRDAISAMVLLESESDADRAAALVVPTPPAPAAKNGIDRKYISVDVTRDSAIHDALVAKAGDRALGPFCLEILAKHVGLAVTPPPATRKRYYSDADRAAAKVVRAAEQKDLNALKTRLLKEYMAAQLAKQNGTDTAN